MLFIATSYYYMNRADPDCGTTFTWVTKAMGPRTGWLGGWAIIVADIIVMANLAQIAGLYTYYLVGGLTQPSRRAAVTALGVVWIAIMTCDRRAKHRAVGEDAELSARSRGADAGHVRGRRARQGLHRRSRRARSSPSCRGSRRSRSTASAPSSAGVLIAVFIYWGWDSARSRSTRRRRTASQHAGPRRRSPPP